MPRKRRYRHSKLELLTMKSSAKKIALVVACSILVVGALSVLYKSPVVTDTRAAQIIRQFHIDNSLFSFSLDEGRDTYIISAISADHGQHRLLTFIKNGERWKEKASLVLNCTGDDCPSDAREVKLGGHQYVYFVTRSSVGEFGTIAFNLFSPAQSHLYSISAYGTEGNINQPDAISADVERNKPVYDYLVKQIEESPKLTRLTDAQTDLLAPENAVQKWLLDNEYIRPAMVEKSAPLKFSYYSTDLASIWDDNEVTNTIENSHYKFTSYFKGGVVGLKKTTNQYFILWVPAEQMEWPVALRFVDPNTVRIGSANRGPTLTVYLGTNQITSP